MYAKLLEELNELRRSLDDLHKAGECLSGCWLENSKPGGSARLDGAYFALRSRDARFSGKKSRYVRKSEVAAVRAALARGKEVARLEREIGQLGQRLAKMAAIAQQHGLELPKLKTHQALLSSDSNEWYTPARFIELARQVMGGIDTDPASNAVAQQWIRAITWYGIAEDGFGRQWHGRVWLNPPYGQRSKTNHGAGAWIEWAIAQYDAGILTQAVLLVRGDSKGIKMLKKRFPSCEPDERISFIREDGSPSDRPVPGCRFFYLGDRVAEFERVFSEIGVVSYPGKAA